MNSELLYLSGNDIPFIQGRITIHPPTIKQIAYLGEDQFWFSCELLNFNKENLPLQDKNRLLNQSNFNILMTMIQENSEQGYKLKNTLLNFLGLLFPCQQIVLTIEKDGYKIKIIKNDDNVYGEINESNYQIFLQILFGIFCLKQNQKQYNPSGDLAAKIAEKIKRGKVKKAKIDSQLGKNENTFSILSHYISILSVGERKNMNDLLGYTVYQLMDEFNRYMLKMKYDTYMQFKCAQFSGMEQPEDWIKNIHNNNNNNS